MHRHLSKDRFATEMLAEVFGYYPDELPADVNLYEETLDCVLKGQIYCDHLPEADEEVVPCAASLYYERLMDDMILYYEEKFVGDDDLGLISEIISWAIDHKDFNGGIAKKLDEVIVFLENKSVIVDEESGAVVKSMCEIIDVYLAYGFDSRHPAQMSVGQFPADNAKNIHEDYSDAELRLVSCFIKAEGYSDKSDYWNNNAGSNINLEKPIMEYRGRRLTPGCICCENELSTDDYLVLVENGFVAKRALEICFLMKRLQREVITVWNAWLSLNVRKYVGVKKLDMVTVWNAWLCMNARKYMGMKRLGWSKISSQTSRKFSVNSETGSVRYWAEKMGVSTTWVNARLRQGMSMAEIVAIGRPCRPNWEEWCIQRPDALHPKRKLMRLSDVLKKEGVTKDEVEKEIGKYQFGKVDALRAIKKIKKRRV